MSNSIAIMQPYFLPYLGYFQLMKSVDKFVIYDDIEYTKKGWINRNRLLFGDKIEYITLPLEKGSDYASIDEREISNQWQKDKLKYERKIMQWYRNRANFQFGLELYKNIAYATELNAFKFISGSVLLASRAIGVETEITQSSSIGDFSHHKGAAKVKEICKKLGAKKYVNAIGGLSLYDKADFENDNIELKFIKSNLAPYQQGQKNFVAGLSILDLIMSIKNDEQMFEQINNYQLI